MKMPEFTRSRPRDGITDTFTKGNSKKETLLKLFPRKLKSRWSGSFKVQKVFPYGVVEIGSQETSLFKVNNQCWSCTSTKSKLRRQRLLSFWTLHQAAESSNVQLRTLKERLLGDNPITGVLHVLFSFCFIIFLVLFYSFLVILSLGIFAWSEGAATRLFFFQKKELLE